MVERIPAISSKLQSKFLDRVRHFTTRLQLESPRCQECFFRIITNMLQNCSLMSQPSLAELCCCMPDAQTFPTSTSNLIKNSSVTVRDPDVFDMRIERTKFHQLPYCWQKPVYTPFNDHKASSCRLNH